ncbi:hypothetical protein AVEN_103266-1 [Araneus ventricosus]|uniref:Uncharacterized protein n=1 Tax=Araneus ventricosus TaxID=182803 RepID=A0A4Y2KQJ7_ARAVE|nr:hypothetical protein AVEN_103266-1 [Araneus ventricosus]
MLIYPLPITPIPLPLSPISLVNQAPQVSSPPPSHTHITTVLPTGTGTVMVSGTGAWGGVLSYRQEKNPEQCCLKWTSRRKEENRYKINRNIWQPKRTSARRGIRFRTKYKEK